MSSTKGKKRGQKKRNVYQHTITLTPYRLKNAERREFAEKLSQIPYLGYKVEDISDGRKVVIAKPGGKKVYGKAKKEDFLVFIYDPEKETLWQLTHGQIYDDIKEKAEVDPEAALEILKVLERVYHGEDPDDILGQGPGRVQLKNPVGENPEALIKAYKWIWGQEDVNYPDGKGRAMSWEKLQELMEEIKQRLGRS